MSAKGTVEICTGEPVVRPQFVRVLWHFSVLSVTSVVNSLRALWPLWLMFQSRHARSIYALADGGRRSVLINIANITLIM